MSDFLADRRKALENQFFAKRNAELLANLREQAKREDQRAALADAAGIADEELLDQLIELGIQAETLAALSLVPLLQVAWSDHRFDDKERDAVLAAAAESGISADSTANLLIQGWLTEELPSELMDAWREYMRALGESLPERQKERLKLQVLGRAEVIAKATGGILGLGNRISAPEQAVLDELASVF